MKLHEYTLKGWVHPADIFVSLYASDEAAFWFDREFHPTKRLSVMGHAYGGKVVSLQQVAEVLEKLDSSVANDFFTPGYVGWVEYPNEPQAETLQVESSFLEVREAIVFDHDTRRIHLVGLFETTDDFNEWVSAALLRLGVMGGQKETYLHRASKPVISGVEIVHRQDDYLAMIESAKAAIAAGEVYQLCLTNQIRVVGAFDALAIFLKLRTSNPSPYSSFIRVGNRTLVSASPEKFFSVQDRKVTTKPIKGTRARLVDPVLDAQAASELQQNQKERAENLMIVDLMRNDLSKFCDEETVKVEKLFDIESYSTVHQLVSTVTGQLSEGVNPVTALLSAFPAGSMTGAPKLRAQQLISDLEGISRGIYSGISGVIGLDGSIEMAMNIRCLVFESNQVSIGIGGGITADSDPRAEFEEIQLKAKAQLGVLSASVNW
ncbi:MAG: anthranilate synthase component I family protein [Micrococcales bacterium]